jgi:PAS domain-containing protein
VTSKYYLNQLLDENILLTPWVFGAFVFFAGIVVYAVWLHIQKGTTTTSWSESLLSILESSNLPWLLYTSKGKGFRCSNDLSELLGSSKNLENFNDVFEFLNKEGAESLKLALKKLLRGQKTIRTQVMNHRGEALYVKATLVLPQRQILIWWQNLTSEQKLTQKINEQVTLLQEERKLLLYLLDSLPTPVWFRNQQGLLEFCNKSYAQALDLPQETIITQNRLLWGYNSTSFKQELSEPLNTEIKKYLIFDGERRLMSFHETADEELGIAGFAVDLTELKKALSELERHTAAYREVLENLSAGVAIYGSDKRIKFFNQAYSRMFDMDENWLHSGPTLGEVLDDLRQRRTLPEHADYAAYKKNQLQMVTTILHPFQELIHLPDERTLRKITSPHPMGGIFYIYEDLTDSLILERKYNIQMAVQRTSLDNLFEGIAVFGSDGRLRLTNAAFRRIWDLSANQCKEGLHMSAILDSCQNFFDEHKDWNLRKSKLLAAATDRIPKKKQVYRQDGSVVDFSYIPLPDGSHLMSCIDISDTYRMEKILRERNEALEKADQLKSELITRVSSELKSPAGEIQKVIEILYKGTQGELNKKQLDKMKSIDKSAIKLLKFADDILNLAKVEAVNSYSKEENISVCPFLRNLIEEMTAKYTDKSGISFTIDCHEDVTTISTDPLQLRQIFSNLLEECFERAKTQQEIPIHVSRENQDIIMTLSRYDEKYDQKMNTESVAPSWRLTLVRNLIVMCRGTLATQIFENGLHEIVCRFPINIKSTTTPKNIKLVQSAVK